jgi:hypothetical protein
MHLKSALALLALCASTVFAQDRVCQPQPCGLIDVCSQNLVTGSGGLTVSCTGTGNSRAITISNVSLINPQAGLLWVEATGNVTISSITIDAPAVTGLQVLQLSVRRRLGTEFSILDLGSVSCTSSTNFIISTIDVQGSISGTVVADSINFVRAEQDISGTIQSDGSSLFPGAIGTVLSLFGNITGTIQARNQVDLIRANNGTIGTPGSLAQIRTGTQINEISARAVYSNINNQFFPPVDSGVLYLRTTNGPFVGQMLARQIETTVANPSGLDIAGPLDADIILGTLSGSPGKIEEPVFVRGGFAAGRTIECKGITSQIIFNRENNPANTIAGTIEINGWNVSPLPYYNQTRSAIGGGSIGLVPFMVHYAESTPSAPFNQPGVPTCGFHATGSARTTITLEHYGRVGFRNGTQWVSQPPANTIGVTV